MPSAFEDLAWTFEGRETTQGDPEALAQYPTREFIDRARLLLAEQVVLDGMPTDEQLRWALGLFAIPEGATRRGESMTSPQVAERLLRYEEAWASRYDALWPERLHETAEEVTRRREAIEQWRDSRRGGGSDQ